MKNVKMWSLLAFLIIPLILIPSKAIEVSKVEINPEVLLPGDFADGKLILTTQKDEDVRSISFKAKGIEITPSFVTEIGIISRGASYELPFVLKATDAGMYSIEVLINTKNDSKKYIFNVEVADAKPILILKRTRLTLNEVNEIEFSLASRINFEKIRVEPLFESEPSVFYFDVLEGSTGMFKFYPTEDRPLSFKISFYNGRNYHETIQNIEVEYENSKGVFLTYNLSFPVLPVNDVSSLSVSLANLRNDRVYGIVVEVSGDGVSFSETRREIPYLDPFTSSSIGFLFSPEKIGKNEITIRVSYKDEMGNDYVMERNAEVTATDQEILGISNLDIKKTLEEVKITGDLSNGGRSKARNVVIEVTAGNITKNFFVGELESGDFFSFDFSLPGATKKGTIAVSWTNELGSSNTITQEFTVPVKSFEKPRNTMLYMGIAAVVVAAIIIVAIVKSRR